MRSNEQLFVHNWDLENCISFLNLIYEQLFNLKMLITHII